MIGLSVCRNPKLAAIFYRLELIEAYGTGIPKIMKSYLGIRRQPKIEVTSNAFKITLPNRNYKNDNDIVFQDAPLTAEERILGYVDKNGYIIRNDVDKLLGVSQSTANRILKRMANGGLILQDGNGRNTKYMKNSTKNEY